MKERVEILLRHPLSNYYLLLGSTLLLLALGLIMVISASSIESYRVFGSAYTLAQRQFLFAGIGVTALFLVTRTSVEFWRAASSWLLIIAFGLLIAVLFVGIEVGGQRNWIDIFGPFRIQPSEFAKLALVVWGANALARHHDRDEQTWTEFLVPLVPVTGGMMLLILLGGDFGNALMIALIAGGLLFASGAPMRLFAIMAGVGLLGTWIATLAAPYRMDRLTAWLDPSADRLGAGWQVSQGQLALGTGGYWGVGLGASREKWGSLPEAHTDFIFSVVGEELGLVGTLAVLVMLAMMAFAIFRVSRMTHDPFVRYAAAGVGAWIVVQSIVNIGGVLGLIPITGVPLPLVSYGGSSLIPTLVAIGMVLAFVKAEPDARKALRRRSTAHALRKR
jgi:cell division protein FtsW